MAASAMRTAAPAALRGVLLLLMLVVGVLCLAGPIDHPRAVANNDRTVVATGTTASVSHQDGTKPCGHKAVADSTAYRAESRHCSPSPDVSAPACPHVEFTTWLSHASSGRGGPTPPPIPPSPPETLHSVLRI